VRHGLLLGLGLSMHLLSRPFETVFLLIAVVWYFAPRNLRALAIPVLLLLSATGITLLQNKRVTGEWMTSPYVLSQYQYGVPAGLTFQSIPVPHRELTPGQELDYKMQASFRPGGRETVGSWVMRLVTRIRSYRFYFFPPLYVALAGFLTTLRAPQSRYLAGVCLLFAVGTNFFPAFRYHYVAGIVGLFMLMAMLGLREASPALARWVFTFAVLHFAFWYGAHAVEAAPLTAVDRWNGINGASSPRTVAANELNTIPGDLLVFVRYWPGHIFQDEWVWNDADIDRARVIFARDLGDMENAELARRYQGRTLLLLEPDAQPPRLSQWRRELPSEPAPAHGETPKLTQRDPFEPVR
jgi:hypothetical protein